MGSSEPMSAVTELWALGDMRYDYGKLQGLQFIEEWVTWCDF